MLTVFKKEGSDLQAQELIQTLINKERLVIAIILDVVAFGDVLDVKKPLTKDADKNSEKLTEFQREFSISKCIYALSNLSDAYTEYFIENYDVDIDQLNIALRVIRKANDQELAREVRTALDCIKRLL